MNQTALAPASFIFLTSIAVGTYKIQHGSPATGVLLLTFGLLGLLGMTRMAR